MSARYFDILRESGHKGNYIPSGRQLPRTPPLPDVIRRLEFCSEESGEDHKEPQQNMEAATEGQGYNVLNRMFDTNTVETGTESNQATSMLKGMTGYQLTPGDLEFIKKMKEEKLIKKLQGELEEVQRLLKKQMMALELVCASRDKAQAELKNFPSCEELRDWVLLVLKMTSPSTDATGLNTKSLLAMVTQESIQRATDEKRIKLARMEKMVANKRKEEAQQRRQLEKQIATEQVKILGLMNKLSDLRSELAQQEETYKSLQMQINSQEEIRVEVEDTSGEQAAKSQVKRRGKERKTTVKPTEKLQDTIKQSKSARSKHADSERDREASVKDDHANKNTNDTLKTSTAKPPKQTSEAVTEQPTKSAKAARGQRKKVPDQEPSSVQEVSRRRKPPGTAQTAASQPENQTKVKTGEAGSTPQQAAPSRSRRKAAVAPSSAGEKAQNAGLRRSKRIASKR